MALIENKKARLNYEILETIEAGMELRGGEVKSLRAGRGKLDGAHVVVRGGEAYLVGASVAQWQPNNQSATYDPERARRLLLSQKELAQVASAEGAKGLTIVPLSVYNRGQFLKLSIAIARGKKSHDKRADIRKREDERKIRRTLKT